MDKTSNTHLNFDNEDWYLENILTYHKSRRDINLYIVKICNESLTLSSSTGKTYSDKSSKISAALDSTIVIKREDIIGFSNQSTSANESSEFLQIFTYPFNTNKKTIKRKRCVIKLEFTVEQHQEHNLNILKLWEGALQHLLNHGRSSATDTGLSTE